MKVLGRILGLILIAILVIVPIGLGKLKAKIAVPPPDSVAVVWPRQNWTPDQWKWWYHISQGSSFEAIIPYKWFTSLEQPQLSFLKAADSFIDSQYLAGFGFLPDTKHEYNPDGLPVGFAKTENYVDPVSQQNNTVVGFTCAACHTGQINYKNKGIRIEGGSAMIDLDKFKTAVGYSLLLTKIDPFRFNRFAERVLGDENTPENKQKLKDDLKSIINKAREARSAINKDILPEGFGRLDALTRIGNFVFGTQINPDNYTAVNAPVNYPHLWSAPWFDWVQYNGSVMQPMTRNAGEAMGVFARGNFEPNSPDVFESNVNVENLYQIENLLSGESIETGLIAPQWPEDILGEIDRDLAQKGEKLYEKNCQGCHLPPVNSKAFKDPQYWTTLGNNKTREYLKLTMKNLYEIGTDPTAAVNWYQRTVDLGKLAQKYGEPSENQEPYEVNGIVTAGFALPFIVEKTVEKKYDELGLTEAQREAYNGYRPNLARTPLAYKARPLNGIWATAPFLHNGSVPNLYEMLVPVEQRSKEFYLGTKEFDPKFVGYKTDEIKNGFLLETTVQGNSNQGHEFKGDGTGKGVIGAQLSEADRWALVEYLKTL
ncbi:MAG: di-heme-cytochrome C peroxidase [Microcystaceae cyanobacterium]